MTAVLVAALLFVMFWMLKSIMNERSAGRPV